jgi:hypothetical protein
LSGIDGNAVERMNDLAAVAAKRFAQIPRCQNVPVLCTHRWALSARQGDKEIGAVSE